MVGAPRRKSVGDELCTLQHQLNANVQSADAELTQCSCRESRLADERDHANTAVSAECLKVTELEKLVDRQARQLDSLNAEMQVSCCSLRYNRC